jgi:cell division protein FtsZ
LERLQAAVHRAPPQEIEDNRPRSLHLAEHDHAPSATERARSGINSLINRMTGQAAGVEMERPGQQVRRQPPVQAEPDAVPPSPEEERIEIPAFLRRQAN